MILLILLLGLILRLIRIDQSFWLDEASQAIMSSHSISSIWFGREGDFHPPLSYIFSHFFLLISHNDIWLRMLPILFGIGSIYVLYLIGQKLFNKNIALIGAVLLAISPYHVYYSQEFRMYSQTVFFALLSIYFFTNVVKKGSFINVVSFAVVSAALIYTHYFGVFLLISLLLYVFLSERNSMLTVIKAFLLIIFLYLPWVPQLLLQLKNGVGADQLLPGWGNVLNVPFLKAIPLTFLKFSIGRIDFENNALYFMIAIVVLSLFFIPIIYAIKKYKESNVGFVIIWLFLPVTLALCVSFFIPLFQPFRLLYVLPAYYVLIAFGLSKMGRYKNILLTAVVFVSIISLGSYYINQWFLREDWKSAVNYVNQNVNDSDLVVFVWPQPFPPYEWYKGNENTLSLVDQLPVKEENVQQKLKIVEDASKIYLFEYLQDLSDPNHNTQEEIINLGFKEGEKKDFSGVGFIQIYQR